MLPQPAALYRELEAGAKFCRAPLVIVQERAVDQLDEDVTVLRGLNRVSDLHQFARGSLGVGEGPESTNFMLLLYQWCLLSSPGVNGSRSSTRPGAIGCHSKAAPDRALLICFPQRS